jgi:transcriptional regulator GlxA family with amidase domain
VHLLETTRLSLEEVSARVGYADPNALRRVMRRHADASPRELRKKGRVGRGQSAG